MDEDLITVADSHSYGVMYGNKQTVLSKFNAYVYKGGTNLFACFAGACRISDIIHDNNYCILVRGHGYTITLINELNELFENIHLKVLDYQKCLYISILEKSEYSGKEVRNRYLIREEDLQLFKDKYKDKFITIEEYKRDIIAIQILYLNDGYKIESKRMINYVLSVLIRNVDFEETYYDRYDEHLYESIENEGGVLSSLLYRSTGKDNGHATSEVSLTIRDIKHIDDYNFINELINGVSVGSQNSFWNGIKLFFNWGKYVEKLK